MPRSRSPAGIAGAARPAHPSLRDHRDRQRILALQEPHSKLKPGSLTNAPDRAAQPRPAPPGRALTVAHYRGPVWTPIQGPHSEPIDILAPSGTLIVASECSEGFGSAEFREAQARLAELGPERFLATLTAKSLAEIDEWQTEMQLKPMRAGRVELYATGLSEGDRALTGVTMIDNVDAAVARSISVRGDPAVAIIAEGPYVVPRYAG